MARLPRRPTGPLAEPAPVGSPQPLGFLPWERPTVMPSEAAVRATRSKRRIMVQVPIQRIQAATPVTGGPLTVTLAAEDLADWLAALAHNPGLVMTLLFDELIRLDATPPRGRHARRIGMLSSRTLRIYATSVYVTLEQWAQQADRADAALQGFQHHADVRGYAHAPKMETGGRWNLSLLTAYAVERGYPSAFDPAFPPTDAPDTFCRAYVWHRALPTVRDVLRRTPSRRAIALLEHLLAEPDPTPPRPDSE